MSEMIRSKGAAAAVAISLPLDIGRQVPAPQAPVRPRADKADLAARAAIVALFTLMCVNFWVHFSKTGQLTALLLLASEALVVVLTVFRRAPAIVDRSIRARVLTMFSTMAPPLLRPAYVAPLVPAAFTIGLSIAGLLVVIAGKMSLGRSFGLMPANRGVVSTGLYRLVRHPIYMGYLMTHMAFLAANPTFINALLLFAADTALLARAVCEERTLAKDEGYRAYQERVRWRVLPGVF
jgi:protein-S-isoprenylcysteine O-methyltransferase Ste14